MRKYLENFDLDFLVDVAYDLGCQFFYDDEKTEIIDIILRDATDEDIQEAIDDLLISETFRRVK